MTLSRRDASAYYPPHHDRRREVRPTLRPRQRRRDAFTKRYRRTYPRAVAILEKDWERPVTFYDFPERHWKHLRTTNVIESPFAAVRLRTDAAKRFTKVANATALLWRMLMVAERPPP
jgi:putative transposase